MVLTCCVFLIISRIVIYNINQQICDSTYGGEWRTSGCITKHSEHNVSTRRLTNTVKQFLENVFTGKMEEALSVVHADAKIIPSRPQSGSRNPIYGCYTGPEGMQKMFTTFGKLLEPGSFDIDKSFAEREHVAMHGKLKHHSRNTGKDFASDWALICKVKNGKIMLYHFYEDTAALEEAIFS